MPDFTWVSTPPFGSCSGCLASVNDKGFVQTWASTNVKNDVGELIGEIDVVFCADCTLQQAKLVGAAMPAEVEAFAYKELELEQTVEKLKDEVEAWHERFLGLAKLDVEDFEKLAKLERASKMVVVTDDPPEG